MRLTWFVAVAIGLYAAQAGSPAMALSVKARAIQPGELIVLTAVTPAPVASIRVVAFDREVPAFRTDPTTWRALVGIDLDVEPGTYPVTVTTAGGAAHRATQPLVVEDKAFPTRRLQVDDAFVNPPARVQARIAEESAELGRIWRRATPDRLWDGPFVRPVPHKANSRFGSRSILNGEARSPHGGADFLSPAGTPVAAPNGGRVVVARDLYYTGGTVAIDHGLGLVSLFAHLSAIDVEVGETVKTGQVLGKVGATGRVTGAHLHWTVRAGGARIDPLALLAVLDGA